MRFSSTILLLCLASPASAGLFNRNKKDDSRRRLTETPQTKEYDMEASTGTVREVPDPKEAEAKTCDGQMAKSLVRANDDLLQAQSERDAASKGQKEKETSNALLEQELKEAKTMMTTKVEKLEEQLEETKEDAAKKVEQSAKQGQEQVAKVEATAQETIAKLQEEKEQLAKQGQEQVAKAEATAQETIAKLLEEKKGSEALKESEQGLLDKQKQKLIAESDVKLQLYKIEMEAKIEGFSKRLESQEQKEEKSVQAAVAKVEEEKAAAVKAVEQEKEALAKENAEFKKSLAEQVASFKSQKKVLESECMEVKNKSAKAIKDLKHWEDLHASRSYCNVTHLTEDASVAALVYKEKAADKLREFKETASVSARKLQVETVRLANENMEKSKKLAEEAMANARPYYEKNVKPNVDKAVEAAKPYLDKATVAAKPYVDKVTVAAKPYFEKATVAIKPYLDKAAVVGDETVFPLLAQAKEEFIMAMEIANNKNQEAFDKVVAKFAEECPKAFASVKNFAKEKDFELPVSMLHSIDTSCKQPRESVIMALYIVGAIFVLLFRKALSRLAKWLILLPFRILWFFNPLRILFGSKKKNVPAPTTKKVPPSGATPVRIKKKQRNNAPTSRVSQ